MAEPAPRHAAGEGVVGPQGAGAHAVQQRVIHHVGVGLARLQAAEGLVGRLRRASVGRGLVLEYGFGRLKEAETILRDASLTLAQREEALAKAADKFFNAQDFYGNFQAQMDRETGEFHVYALKQVVQEVEEEDLEISLAEAQELNPEAAEGDTLWLPQDTSQLGRIAAQVAKSAGGGHLDQLGVVQVAVAVAHGVLPCDRMAVRWRDGAF